MESLAAKSPEASQLRRRRGQLARRFGIPEKLVGNSLTRSHRRCGKGGCHCSSGRGHPQMSLSLSHKGVRTQEKIPGAWVEELEQAVLDAQCFLDAVKEVMAINLELLALSKRQRRTRCHKRDVRGEQKVMKSRSTFREEARSYFHVTQTKS